MKCRGTLSALLVVFPVNHAWVWGGLHIVSIAVNIHFMGQHDEYRRNWSYFRFCFCLIWEKEKETQLHFCCVMNGKRKEGMHTDENAKSLKILHWHILKPLGTKGDQRHVKPEEFINIMICITYLTKAQRKNTGNKTQMKTTQTQNTL